MFPWPPGVTVPRGQPPDVGGGGCRPAPRTPGPRAAGCGAGRSYGPAYLGSLTGAGYRAQSPASRLSAPLAELTRPGLGTGAGAQGVPGSSRARYLGWPRLSQITAQSRDRRWEPARGTRSQQGGGSARPGRSGGLGAPGGRQRPGPGRALWAELERRKLRPRGLNRGRGAQVGLLPLPPPSHGLCRPCCRPAGLSPPGREAQGGGVRPRVLTPHGAPRAARLCLGPAGSSPCPRGSLCARPSV